MIEAVIRWSIRRRAAVFAGAVALALAGFWAIRQTPVDAIPDLSEPQVIVLAQWEGHAPEEIAELVAHPLANGLAGIEGLRVVRSSSDVNFALLNAIFVDGFDVDSARRQIAARLDALAGQLPPGATCSAGPDGPATGQVFWYILQGTRDSDLGELRELHDLVVKPQMAAVPGVAEVASVGGYVPEFQIRLDPQLLAARGGNLEQVQSVVIAACAPLGGTNAASSTREYLLRGRLGGDSESASDPLQLLKSLPIPLADGSSAALGDLAHIVRAPAPRRGALEVDGNEVVGGIVLMQHGGNPLELTQRLHAALRSVHRGLPEGVRLSSGYDRTPLILGAVSTVAWTVIEAILVSALCVWIVLLNLRAAFIIAVSLPLAVCASFLAMWGLRISGLAAIDTNAMSLAGLAISIGVLVDASIVTAENCLHELRHQYGDEPVCGDTRQIVARACTVVGRPLFFSVLIMLVSFLPVFALAGLEGKMFRPLAFTKCFALVAVAALAITLVPALCTIFLKGRMRSEEESWLVRSILDVYRPLLNWLLDRPAPLIWLLAWTTAAGCLPLGQRTVFLATLGLGLACVAGVTRGAGRWLAVGSLLVAVMAADLAIQPLGRQFLAPLDEGTVMDMPITVPRASLRQSVDDLKARDMVLCRFPEVAMAMGKAGRAETALDPAPVDMIETMVSFQPRERWPRRKLDAEDALRFAHWTVDRLTAEGLLREAADGQTVSRTPAEIAAESLSRLDALLREYCFHRYRETERNLANELGRWIVENLAAEEFQARLGRQPTEGEAVLLLARCDIPTLRRLAAAPQIVDLDAVQAQINPTMQQIFSSSGAEQAPQADRGAASTVAMDRVEATFASLVEKHRRAWLTAVRQIDDELRPRACESYARLLLETLLTLPEATDQALSRELQRLQLLRTTPPRAARRTTHHGAPETPPPDVVPLPKLDALQAELTASFQRRARLTQKSREDLVGFGGEMDLAVQMPGWTNVWTMPIQNRVDMLATGVTSLVGIRVLGENLDDVLKASEEVADAIRQVPGAVDVLVDPVRGKGYLTADLDPILCQQRGLDLVLATQYVQAALGGTVVAEFVHGRARTKVRVAWDSVWSDPEWLPRLPMPTLHALPGDEFADPLARLKAQVQLREVARVAEVDGPASIKAENGLLRNYVRLNVRDRDVLEFVRQAKQLVARDVQLPPGVYLEWTGQFEHQQRVRWTLSWIIPVVLVVILGILYATYRDLADALLVLLAVPGCWAGGVLLQWLLGYEFSVTVTIGYLACFGMATATGIIMLVYLRQAVELAGGLETLDLSGLRAAVLRGAVNRLRPKLLTEATTILGLAPLLWASGVGAEVVRPMAAPVLGGILVADEVVDLLLPMAFYWVRKRRWQRLHGANAALERACGATSDSYLESPAEGSLA